MIALCAVISGADSWSQVDIALYFKDPDKNHTDFFQTIDGEHGRIETRSYTTTSDIKWFQEKHLWAGLKTICKVTRLRDVRGSLPGSKRSLS
jgi:predicted double-glycine peptidase